MLYDTILMQLCDKLFSNTEWQNCYEKKGKWTDEKAMCIDVGDDNAAMRMRERASGGGN